MNKSDVVRDAAERSEVHKNTTPCYCTPSRAMALSLRKACASANLQDPDVVAREMQERLAEELRKRTNRERRNESLSSFDTMDTDAAYAIWNGTTVVDSFEAVAVRYQVEEVEAWDAAKAAWEESVRTAAKTRVSRKTAPPLDPAAHRAKAKAKAKTVEVEA